MTELLTAAQMRAIEQAAIASGEVTGLELMERAGRGVVEAILEEWPELARGGDAGGRLPPDPRGYLGQTEKAPRAVVLCGPGNNGGDGFVVARLLKERGWEVLVYLYGDPDKLPPDARVNYERWRGMGEVTVGLPGSDDTSGSWVERAIFAYDRSEGLGAQNFGDVVVIDALFGTGLTRQLGEASLLTQEVWHDDLYDLHLRVVAVDIPSGICADSGRVLEGAKEYQQELAQIARPLAADLTVTFHSAKLGHVLDDAAKYCGRLRVVDIGLPDDGRGVSLTEFYPIWLDKMPSWREPAHKYGYGHTLILSGPPGRGGAARLSARGALRIGAGLVTVGCPPDALAEHAARLDAVMLREVADAGGLAGVLGDRRINALCLGPGLGLGAREAALVGAALQARRRTVLDADALTLIARDPALFGALHKDCVLTPHAGEFGRLFPDLAARLATPATTGPAWSKVDAAREAAARAGCVVLFKGPDTVIATPDGRCAVNAAVYDRAAPWLATAGSGDVLAGFITGMLARGFGPFDAACTGAWLHVEAARSFGPGLIAEDLPEELPKVFRALGL